MNVLLINNNNNIAIILFTNKINSMYSFLLKSYN